MSRRWLVDTPDVTCECGHRRDSHDLPKDYNGPGCYFCLCEKFTPRDRSIPPQPVQFYGSEGQMPYGPRRIARKNEEDGS